MNVLNYPIKYAVLELKQDGRYLTNYQKYTSGFIVSKCYVIKSEIDYYSNGGYNTIHHVVFPYDDFGKFVTGFKHDKTDIGKREYPSINSNLNSTHVVSDLFDTYEEAKESAKEKNEYLRADLTLSLSILDEDFMKKLEEINNNFLTKLAVCNRFEELVLKNTEDMNITLDEKTKIIKLDKSVK